MEKQRVEKELLKFRDLVINESKQNLKRMNKIGKGTLLNSIKGTAKVSRNSIELNFSMEGYGVFQDQGVNGMSQYRNSPFKFRKGVPNKMMLQSLGVWMKAKGIQARGKDGKFKDSTGLKFAIARNIFKRGIKRSLFFTKPFMKAFKGLSNELIEAYGLDAKDMLSKQFDEMIKELNTTK